MKQFLRLNTFETNSSSMHTLVILNKEEFDKFKNKELFYSADKDEFLPYSEIENMESFIEQCPYYNDLSDENKKQALKEFIDEYFDTDYAVGYTLHGVDSQYKTVYNNKGEEQIALSMYIGDC